MNAAAGQAGGDAGARGRYGVFAVLLATILFATMVRVRLLDVPLQRDEGEYAYAGQLLLEGTPPYSELYNAKLPGTYAAYAVVMALFGQSPSGIHLGLLVVNAATTLLLFLLGRRLFDPIVGVSSAVAFSLLSLGRYVRGSSANDEHFVILFAVGGLLLLVRAVDLGERGSMFTAGISLGLAFLMKQHGAAFLVFAGAYLVLRRLRGRASARQTFPRQSALLLVGALLPVAVTCLALWWSGVFDNFVFWVFRYGRRYVSVVPPSAAIRILGTNLSRIIPAATPLWILSGIGLVGLWIRGNLRRRAPFVSGFLLFSFLSTCPGFYFRPHYFLLLLPAVALLGGVGAGFLYANLPRARHPRFSNWIGAATALALFVHTVALQRDFFFRMTPETILRKTYYLNPFPESPEIGRYIRENSAEGDRIAVFGSEPQIFFYAKRRSATGYVYAYPLMEPQPYALRMQREMVREIEAARPEYLVRVNIPDSWLKRPDSASFIVNWSRRYAEERYQKVGVVEILGPGATVYRWGEEAARYAPRASLHVDVYRRVHE